jgi:type II secretory ATPase GspE/PulE/Tfp pilus assembly ATPase PilB-like protein
MVDSDKKSQEATASQDYSIRPLRKHLVSELLQAIDEREEQPDEKELEYPSEVDGLLRDAVRERATDIHLDTKMEGVLVRMRKDGVVLDAAFLPLDQGRRLTNQLKILANLNPVTGYLPEEGRTTYDLDGQMLDLRLAHAPCLRGDKLSIRLFGPFVVPQQLHELGLVDERLEHIRDWLDNMSGMLLVTGPTGSGKTTTLYALLHRLKLRERNVVTIEDPVEYEIDGINHIQVDKVNGLGFAEGMSAMLRLDPDYLMLGEIRDTASANAAITAAASGHAMMSTLHSRDAVAAVDVLRNYGMSGHDISANLMMVVAQRLVRVLCPNCRVEEAPTKDEERWLTLLGREVPERVWHARECEHCNGLGYQGRTGVFEVWRIDSEEYQLLLDEADRRTLYRHLAERGHHFLLDDGLEKAKQGITTLDELRVMGGFSVLHNFDEATD